MAQDVKVSNINPAKNIVKVNILRANVKQTKVIDTDIVFVLEDGRTVFIRDGAVQSLLDNGFSVEFSDGMLVSGQELLQSAGTAEISSIALTGPQASSNDGVIVVQAPQATVASAVEKSSSRSGISTWLAVGTPVVGGVLAGVLSGGGGGSSTTPDNGSGAVKPAMPVINVIANDDKVNAAEKAAGVTVAGNADANASVTVNWGNTTKTVTADGTGRWSASFASTEVPADAAGTTVSATVKSTAGVSSDPATKTVQVDATPPGVPVIGKVAGDGNIGPAEKAAGVSITGTAEAGSTITVVFGTVSKSVVAGIDGNWSISYASTELPEQPGTYSVTATARDANGNISATTAPSTVTVTPAVDVTGQVIAGPLVPSHGLTVSIYRADGTLLVSGVKVNADGSFTAKELAVGLGDVIIAKVVDATPGEDYLDETTLLPTDLNAELLAVKAVEGTSVTMNINPLTTIAAIKAGLAADGSGTIANAAAATNANKAVAQAFGISGIDITTTPVVATNSSSFSPVGGLSSGEKVGTVLAALSGYDYWNKGNSQTTITMLSNELIVDGSKGLLANSGQLALMQGAIVAEDRVDGSLQTMLSNSVAETSPTSQVTIGAIATDNIISASEVPGLTFSGKVSSDVVGVSVVLGTRKVAATISGSEWSYKLSAEDLTALGGDGPKIIDAVAELANATTVTSSRLFALKTAPPAIPTLAAVAGNNGINAAERDAGISFTGRGDVGSTVTLKFGSITREVAVDATGAWTISLLTGDIPTDGRVPVSVSAKDPFGNISESTIPRLIEIDVVAPGKPTILPVTGDGTISPAEKTAGVKIEGKAEAGATVRLKFGSVDRSTTADASGNWFVNLLGTELPGDGLQTFTVSQTDVAGNESEATAGSVTIDANAPPKPVILAVSSDDRISAAERNVGVTVRGTSEPNAKIEITWGTTTRSTTASSTGSWSLFYAGGQLPREGTENITATATDTSGNKSAPSDPRAVTIDTSIVDVIINSVTADNIINASEKLAGVRISGRAEANAEVFVTLGGKEVRGFANGDGEWSVDFAASDIPADGLKTKVTAYATDQAGNKSREQTHEFDIITAQPARPTIDTPIAFDDIVNAAERTAGVTISGRADPEAEVTIVWGTTGSETIKAEKDGTWRVTFPTGKINESGLAEISVTQKNVIGNISEAAKKTVTVNAAALPKPDLDPVTDDNKVNADEVAKGLTITGKGLADATIKMTWGTIVKETTVLKDGTWKIDLGEGIAPGDGEPILSVTQTDKDGNVSAAETRNISVDREAPAIPVVIGPISDGAINLTESNDGVTIRGTAPVDTKIQVRIGGGTAKEVTSTGAGTWSVTFAKGDLPNDGKDLPVEARTLDAVGNASAWAGGAGGVPVLVNIDTSAPPKPVISTIEGDDKINFAELVDGVIVSGTAEQLEPNAMVEITWRVKSSQVERIKRDVVVVDGKWTATFTEAEIGDSAELEVVVTAKDLAGNISEAATKTVEVNNGRPAAPAVDNVTDDDKVNAAEVTAGLTITGTGLAGAKINLIWGTVRGETTVLGDGTWKIALGAGVAPADGEPALIVSQTDTNGIPSLPTSRNITVDRQVPDAPVVLGPISGDVINLAEANVGVTVTGIAPVGEAVQVRIGDGTEKRATFTGPGAWTVTFAKNELPADGTNLLVQARTIDAVGNQSIWSGGVGGVAIPVTIDTSVPLAPTIDTPIALDNKINADELADQVDVIGRAEANAVVTVYWRQKANDTLIKEKSITADSSGIWLMRFNAEDINFSGEAYVVAIQKDVAGNESPRSGQINVQISTSKPNTPVIDPIAALADGYLNNEEADLGVTITGTGTPGQKVSVTWGGHTESDDSIGQDGKWSVFFAKNDLPIDGTYAITAVQKDALGNESTPASLNDIIVDRFAPMFPAVDSDIAGDGFINLAEKTAGVTISGIAIGATKVDIRMGSFSKNGIDVVDGKWTWTLASSDVPGNATDLLVEGKSYDAAGNTRGWSEMTTVTIDTTVPNAPVLDPVAGNDNIVNASEMNGSVRVSGRAEPESTVKVQWGTTTVREIEVGENGIWSTVYRTADLTVAEINNTTQITVTATDKAGNISAPTSRPITIDTIIEAPVFDNVTPDNKVTKAERESSDGVIVSGTAEAKSTLRLVWGATTKSNILVGDDRKWSVKFATDEIPNPGIEISAQNTQIQATVTDQAGNISATRNHSVVVDVLVPTPVFLSVTGNNRINAAEKNEGFSVSVTASDAVNVQIKLEDGTAKTATKDAVTNEWSVLFTSDEIPTDQDELTFSAQATDSSGNVSAWVKSNIVLVDLDVPGAPSINNVSVDDKINAAENSQNVTVSGTSEPNATVKVKWGDLPERDVTASVNGVWTTTYTPTQRPSTLLSKIIATQTDFAGNVGTASAQKDIEIDTVAPLAPTITGMSNDYGTVGDFITDRNRVFLTGTGEANAKIRATIAGVQTIVDVDAFGHWVSPEINLSGLNYSSSLNISFAGVDNAGNISTTSVFRNVRKELILSTQIDLSTMPATTGFTVAGARSQDRMMGLATGNINGDGFSDLIFNSSQAVNSNAQITGAVTVVYGQSNYALTGSRDLFTMGLNNGWVLQGSAAGDLLGASVGFIGDLNKDGFGELIAGASGVDNGSVNNAGAAYIVWGSSGPIGLNNDGRTVLSAEAITPAQGFVFRGLTADENLGGSTLGISSKFEGSTNLNSDFNGDGLADFFIGAQNFDRDPAQNTDVGAVIVVFGREDRAYGTLNTTANRQEMTINDLNQTNGFIIRGASDGDTIGVSISSAGDVNGDGVTDLLIGANGVDRGASSQAGAVYVVYGKKSGESWGSLIDDPTKPGRKILDLGTLKSSDGFMIQGEEQNGFFGGSVEGLGDINGDGFGDIGIGAGAALPLNAGKAYVIFGSNTGQGSVVGERQVLDTTTMTLSQGFIINGPSGWVGQSVGAAGDVNKDGLADFIVSAPFAPKSGQSSTGVSYVIYGKDKSADYGQFVAATGQNVLNLTRMGSADGFSIIARASGDNLGNRDSDSSVIAPGDLNNDGIDDLFINNFAGDTNSRTNNGEAVFVYGARNGGGLTLIGTSAGGEVLNGSDGSDFIDWGGGAGDVVRGFAGNDTFTAGNNIAGANSVQFQIDGGTGTDTLRIGFNGEIFNLDLPTQRTGAIKDIEVIDLVAGSLVNTLSVTQQSLLDISSTTDILKVLGDTLDTVNANGFVSAGSKVENGITFNTYKSGLAELWTQQGVKVNGTTAPPIAFVAPDVSWANHAVLAA